MHIAHKTSSLNFSGKYPKVAVLMSAFNGGRYILEQINSILSQLRVEDRIYIRDDCSNDDTVEKINGLNCNQIILVQSSKNMGFGKSFMKLIQEVPDEFDFYFLADQDDIWMPGKKERALDGFFENETPKMICTRLRIVDEHLRPIGVSPNYIVAPSFRNAICQNIATGCTIALNNSAIKLMKNVPFSCYEGERLYYHDWWLYLNMSYFGRVVFDAEPSVLYRQHGRNQIGMGGGWRRYLTIIRAVSRRPWFPIMIGQLNLFYEVNRDRINKDDLIKIYPLCHGSSWSIFLSLFRHPFLKWQNPSDKILFRVLLLREFFQKKIPNMKY